MRVLVVAYFFPPVGGAGVARWVRMAHHLAEMGVTPVILTGSGEAAGEWRPADRSVVAEDLEVHRVPGPEPRPNRRGARAWARRPDAWARWWAGGVREMGLRLGAGCDAIVATMSPFESAEPVRDLARRLDRPWIADLRDPWAIDEVRTFHTGLHRRLEVRRMAALLSAADAVVMNTAEARRRALGLDLGLDPRRVHVVTNGAYPRSDGAAAAESGQPFTIVHTGMLHTAAGRRLRDDARRNALLGRMTPGLDLLARSHVFLLDALRRTDLPVRLDLIGDLSPDDIEVSRRCGPKVEVRHLGYLPRAESRARVEAADLLFLPMHGTGGRRATIVPEKTYEYLAAGRPLLAAVPPGDARDLLTGNDRVYVCDPTDVVAMAAAVRREITLHDIGAAAPMRNPSVLAPFDPSTLARRMAQVLESTLSPRRAARDPRSPTTLAPRPAVEGPPRDAG